MDTAAATQTEALGRWVAELQWGDVPTRVQGRLRLVLLDVLGVTLLGAQDPEQQRLVDAWDLVPGPAPVVGTGHRTSVESAAWLNASALVRLELDEGNKFAKGHPAAHGFPAVLALAAARDAAPGDLLASLLVAYEVASRFGRATSLRDGAHPHGSWGVAGAAAARGCSGSTARPPRRPSTPGQVCRSPATSPVLWTVTGSETRGWERLTSLG